jgi:hypothetical protein
MSDDTTDTTTGGPETPRPGSSFQGAAHPADGRPISDVAARVGPPVVLVSLAITVALLVWMAIAPTAVAGPIAQAPFTVPATLLVTPDDDGCLSLVEGDGTSTEHCSDDWVNDQAEDRYVDAYFDAQGRLLVGAYPELSIVDVATGDVIGTVNADSEPQTEPGREFDEDAPQVYGRGDRVYRNDNPTTFEREPGGDELLLDLQAPPGYEVTDAVLSPDGTWLLVRTNRDQVLVAPADGSTAPYEWTVAPDDRWVDLRSHVRWDS